MFRFKLTIMVSKYIDIVNICIASHVFQFFFSNGDYKNNIIFLNYSRMTWYLFF